MKVEEVTITEPAVLLVLDRSYRKGMSKEELYEITRSEWRLNPKRWLSKPKYAVGIVKKKVVSIFEIEDWQASGNGRVQFVGKPAHELRHYIGKSVKEQKGGNRREIFFVNLPEPEPRKPLPRGRPRKHVSPDR